jgi:tRNA-dihydrouridine synthase A
LQNLFYGEPNAKRWRRAMDDALKRDAKNPDVCVSELIDQTLREGGVSDETLDAPPSVRRSRKPTGDGLSDEEAAEKKRLRLRDAAKKLRSLPPPPTRSVKTRVLPAPAR